MPTCRSTTLRPNLAGIYRPRSAQATTRSLVARARNSSARRYASAAAALPKPASKVQPERYSVRTVLHKTEGLLPRVLSVHDDPSKTTSLAFWQDILNQAYVTLNASSARGAARIVVYGTDEYSGVEDLVTALLEEPFATVSHKQVVQNRWKDAEGQSSLVISHAFSPSEDPSILNVPVTWLKQFAVPVELEEFKAAPSTFHAAQRARSLFAADIPIIVINPLTTPIQSVLSNSSLPLRHAGAILVVITSPNLPSGTWKKVTQAFPDTLTTLFVDPPRAIGAIRTLSMDPGSSLSVQRYQDDYTGSRLADLTSILKDKISAASQGDTVRLNEVTVREQVQVSLEACHLVLQNAEKEVGGVVANLLALKDEVAELKVRVGPEILGAEGHEVATEAVARAKNEVEISLNSLTWWKAVTRVDDVGEIVRAAVDKAWCRELEDKLLFHAGRLASSQRSLARSTTELLSHYTSPSPFHSPVLENSLSQLQASSSYHIRPTSLTSPIHQRKAQLVYPTQALHSTAQGIALGAGGSVMSGLGLAWAGWAEHLGILGDLFGTGLQVETAVGAGMLVTALGIRWMVGRWEKAKKKWWKDWDRIGQGLERDLKITLDRTISTQVLVVPSSAADTLEKLAKKRREEIEILKDELVGLQHEVKQS
ncbi:hypothetical protein BDY19DRAFT_897157 [Irpex rosettiformis]|uniref:Uncharacterized protein n=1 Tax=Irpex rosettiformis TaxID=378272 RepID=A0ACB8TSZ1_9APHY|nr:hypothetical protein BDY19DRAFT_897157 [Irpex rosettiformis]